MKLRLLDSYIRNGCGAFLRVEYSDDQCVWDSWKHTGNVDPRENGRLEFFIRPKKDELASLGATQAQQEMMFQPITLSWIWTHKSNNGQYVDWYLVNSDYHEPYNGTDEWSVVPYSWLKPAQAAQYQKDFSPPEREVPPDTRYWSAFDIKIVCSDDISSLESRHCNFGVSYVEVPNFTWTEGEKAGLWHLKNRHHDPEYRVPTIKFEPLTDGDAHDTFSTFAAINFLSDEIGNNGAPGPKGWGHFINAKVYNSNNEVDKNMFVQFKIEHNINPNTDKKIKFFYTDPDQHGESWNIKPTNSQVNLMDTNGDWKDETERRKGVGADDNYGDPGGFYASAFNYGAKEMEKTPFELPSGSRISFKTNRYGGDNFIPKAYFITPACFQWGRLGETNTDEAITVWRKYPVVTSTTFLEYKIKLKDKDGNYIKDQDGKYLYVTKKIESQDWLEKVMWNRDYGVKGAYDDAFILILPPGPSDPNNPHKLLDDINYDPDNPPKNLRPTLVADGSAWLRDFSDDNTVGVGFHSKVSAPINIVHNSNLIFNADDWFKSISEQGNHLGMSVMDNDKEWAVAGVCDVAVENLTDNENDAKRMISWMITHELGHTICYLSHNSLDLNDISVMTYYTENGYPRNIKGKVEPIVQFDLNQMKVMRAGTHDPVDLVKIEGFFERRSQP